MFGQNPSRKLNPFYDFNLNDDEVDDFGNVSQSCRHQMLNQLKQNYIVIKYRNVR